MSLLNKLKKLAHLSLVIPLLSSQLNAEEMSKAKEIIIEEKSKKNKEIKLEGKFEEEKYSFEDLKIELNNKPNVIFKAEENEKRIKLGYEFDKLFFGTDYLLNSNIAESKFEVFTGLEINDIFSMKLKLTNEEELTNILITKTPRDSYFCLSSFYKNNLPCFKSIYFERVNDYGFILSVQNNANNVETSLSIRSRITKKAEDSFILDHDIVNKLDNLNKKNLKSQIDISNMCGIIDLVGDEFLDFSFDINYILGKNFSVKSALNIGDYSIFKNIILNSELYNELNINQNRINNGITTELYECLKLSYQYSLNNKLNQENTFLISYQKSF